MASVAAPPVGGEIISRPPFLIGPYRLTDLGGGEVALRPVGIVAVVVSVLPGAALVRARGPADRLVVRHRRRPPRRGRGGRPTGPSGAAGS